MKYIILLAILTPGWANAQPVWVKTAFWQTAFSKVQNVKLKSETKLDDICEEYSLMVAEASRLSARELETIRTNTDQMNESQFSSVFVVDRASTDRLIAQSLGETAREVSSVSAQDLLPRYTQTAAGLSPLDKIHGLQIAFGGDSLSRISQMLGLRPLRIEVVTHTPQIRIRVYGRDSACDLYSGKASLAGTSTGTVKISLDEQLLLNEFYQSLEEATENAFKRSSSPMGRMVLLGYHLNPSLSPLRLPAEKALGVVGLLVTTFFNERGERNEVWTSFNGKPHLSVNGAAQVQFQLKFER